MAPLGHVHVYIQRQLIEATQQNEVYMYCACESFLKVNFSVHVHAYMYMYMATELTGIL